METAILYDLECVSIMFVGSIIQNITFIQMWWYQTFKELDSKFLNNEKAGMTKGLSFSDDFERYLLCSLNFTISSTGTVRYLKLLTLPKT